jgi:hypothetical protein
VLLFLLRFETHTHLGFGRGREEPPPKEAENWDEEASDCRGKPRRERNDQKFSTYQAK